MGITAKTCHQKGSTNAKICRLMNTSQNTLRCMPGL